MHFKELEERLKKLEVIALSSSDCQEAEEGLKRQVTPVEGRTSSTPPSGNALPRFERSSKAEEISIRGRAHDVIPTENRHSGTWKAELVLLQEEAVQGCHERINQLVHDALEEGRLRLQALADEMTPFLQARVEKMLQRSAGVVVSQVTELLEQEIQIATRRSLFASLACTKAGAESVTAEGGTYHGAASGQRDKLELQEFEQELFVSLEEIRKQSAAFLESLSSQMQRALEDFKKNSAKKMTAGFQQMAYELPVRELETAEGPHDIRNEEFTAPEMQAIKMQKPVAEALNTSGIAPVVGIANPQGSGRDADQQRLAAKSQKKEATWRILGLSE